MENDSSASDNPDQPVRFTGMVITCNEERHLSECLQSLVFCQQLVVIDLGSTDSSVEIARKFGAEIVMRERVPISEMIRQEAMGNARNNWVVFIDPDEVLPHGIETELRDLIGKDSNLGEIKVPWQFYFRGRPITSTKWGIEQEKKAVHHKERTRFMPYVHRSKELLEGYTSASVPRKTAGYFMKHYWADTYSQLFEKHIRYIRYEGETRYLIGERFSWVSMIRDSIKALKGSLIDFRGLSGGFIGIFLSFFHCWYICMRWLSLRKYESRHG